MSDNRLQNKTFVSGYLLPLMTIMMMTMTLTMVKKMTTIKTTTTIGKEEQNRDDSSGDYEGVAADNVDVIMIIIQMI